MPTPALSHIQALLAQGRAAEARDALLPALARNPSAPLDHLMALAQLRLGALDQAEYFATRAFEATQAPDPAVTLAAILSLRGNTARAAAILELALRRRPDHLHARLALADVLRRENRLTDALATLEPALGSAPPQAQPSIRAAHATTLLWLGQPEEAWRSLRAAADRFPDDELLATSLANAACYHPSLTHAEEYEAHRRYGLLFERNVRVGRPPYAGARDPDRRLRVGFLSPDLRRHSVAWFLLPLWAALDPGAVEVIGYASNPPDDLTPRLAAAAHEFRQVQQLSDQDLARLIHEDRIDILIDLAGHTQGRRLPVFYLKPAPVQAAYLGYPGITGLSRAHVAARFTDALADPPESFEHADGEELLRLPAPFLTYAPPVPPEQIPLAAGRRSAFTFVSFNALPKVNDGVVAAWAAILRARPEARLLLKAPQLGDPHPQGPRARLSGRLTALGVEPGRVELLGPTPNTPAGTLEHLRLYHRADLALDTFPYHGTTTTCEAALMGVPTVTLAGDRHRSRVGITLNTALGVGDLIAGTPDQYVALAAGLAADPERLAALRAPLRERLLTGPLADAPRLARGFEAGLRTLWRRWCAGPG